ncbi:O-antigen ligase family protein [Priestia megaterium]
MNIVKISTYFFLFSYIWFFVESGSYVSLLKLFSVFVFAFALLVGLRNVFKKRLIPKMKTWVFLFFFNLLGSITSLYSEDPKGSLVVLFGLNLYFLIFHLCGYRFSLSKEKLVEFNGILIKISLLLVTYALGSNPVLTLSQFHTLFIDRIRVYGTFVHPNELGITSFVSLIACFINLKLYSKRKYKVFMLLAMAYFFTCMILSDSRGALYSFLLFLSVYHLLAFMKQLSSKYEKFITPLVMLLIAVCYAFMHRGILTDEQAIGKFSTGRLGNWKVVWDYFITNDPYHFLFGYGLNGVDKLQAMGFYTDNGYLVWMYEAGLFNTILVLLVLINLLRKNILSKSFNTFGVAIFCSYMVYTTIENLLTSFGIIASFYCWLVMYTALFEHKVHINKKRVKQKGVIAETKSKPA